jgi:C-terminal processing protease CtpA/Prc
MTFTEKSRRDVLNKIDNLVAKKFYDPKFKGHDWPALVENHRDRIMSEAEPPAFEGAVNNMLRELGSSGLGLISPKTRIASKNAISATFQDCETEYGRRWVFQDVHAGGPAANAGIKPGDVLMSIGGTETTPADKKPLFAMGQSHDLVIEKVTGTSNVTISIPIAKHAENPCAVPDRVRVEMIDGVPVVKIPLFPGKLGIDFAAQVSEVFDSQLKSVDRLVLDLRGNPGGGLGCLRLMSILTPGNKPIGFSLGRAEAQNGYDRENLPRFSRIPRSKFEVPWLALRFAGRKSVVLVTEGIGARRFQERVVVLVNEHTTCASEMVALFAREETGAKIFGTTTPGRLVSHSGFKLDHGFTLALPVAAYMSWTGTRLDGTGIEPEFKVNWSYSDSRRDIDTQLSASVYLAKSL